MNPFREGEEIFSVSSSFYRKFYTDNTPRHLILGINPGGFGAGVTAIPFIVERIGRQIELGIRTDVCFCFGTGKNEKFQDTFISTNTLQHLT